MESKKMRVSTTKSASDAVSIERGKAATALDPSCGNAIIVTDFGRKIFGKLDEVSAYVELKQRAQAVRDGDLSSAEAMLTGQAAALNAMFGELTRRGGGNMGADLQVMESYMRLALKAQSQCRATLETLAAIKNPPVVYARQANFANGPQQVNNAVPAHAGELKSAPNKLMEVEHDETQRLDLGTPGEAIGGDSKLATVGPVNRTKVR